MHFSRNLRQWFTACTLGFMLLAQQSVAAYACTTSLQGMAKAAAAMPDCENEAGAAVSALCLEHCKSGSEAVGQIDVAWTTVAVPVLLYYSAVPPAIALPAIDARQHHPAYAPSPPLIVRLQRFLI